MGEVLVLLSLCRELDADRCHVTAVYRRSREHGRYGTRHAHAPR